jgi:LysM repeat protein
MKRHRILLLLLLLPLFLIAARATRADTIHVVEPGDTLWRISMKYGVSMEAIAEANNLTNIRVIRLGRELIIPGVDNPLYGSSAATPAVSNPLYSSPVTARPYTIPDSAVATEGGVIHTVEAGDTLSRISLIYNITMDAIAEANEITDRRVVSIGQKIFVPGAKLPATPTATTTPAPTGETAAAATPAPADNLFKNGSFEDDWYYHIYNELQIPVGWQLTFDEGPNNLQPGDGGNFARPEVRVVDTGAFPPEEQSLFIFDGNKTVKAFKGYAPTTFSIFQDVHLQPGRYRMTLNFFPDLVANYNDNGNRVFATDPLAGEMRIIHNDGGSGWTTVSAGQRNTRVHEFTVTQPGGVRLGAAFRNRFGIANNGWFLDDWRLERVN